MIKRYLFIINTFLIVGCSSFSEFAIIDYFQPTFTQDQKLGRQPEKCVGMYARATSNLHHFICPVFRSKNKFDYYINGQKLESELGEIEWLRALPNGRLLYAVKNKKYSLVMHGDQKGTTYADIGSGKYTAVSNQGDYAYKASHFGRNGGQAIVRNGIEGRAYPQVFSPQFSSSGKLAYIVKDGSTSFVVMDAQEGRPFTSNHYSNSYQYKIRFHKKGEHYMYLASTSGRKNYVVHNDQVYGPYEYVQNWTLNFSPNGKRVSYVIRKDRKNAVVIDGKTGPFFDDIGDTSKVSFDPSGTNIVYIAIKGKKQFVMYKDKAGKKYDKIHSLNISPDGTKLAYIANQAGEKFIILNNKKLLYPFPGHLAFGPNNHLIFSTGKEPESIFFKGKKHKPYNRINEPVFNKDGSRIAYVASDGYLKNEYIVINGREAGKFDKTFTSPVFSPDGKHLVLIVKKDAKTFVFVDGKLWPTLGAMVSKIKFSKNSQELIYLVMDEKRMVYRKRIQLKKK